MNYSYPDDGPSEDDGCGNKKSPLDVARNVLDAITSTERFLMDPSRSRLPVYPNFITSPRVEEAVTLAHKLLEEYRAKLRILAPEVAKWLTDK